MPLVCTAHFGLPFVPLRGIWDCSLSSGPGLRKVPLRQLQSVMLLALVTVSATLWSIYYLSVKPSDKADVDEKSTVSNISKACLKRPAASFCTASTPCIGGQTLHVKHFDTCVLRPLSFWSNGLTQSPRLNNILRDWIEWISGLN